MAEVEYPKVGEATCKGKGDCENCPGKYNMEYCDDWILYNHNQPMAQPLNYPDCCIGCEYAYKNEALQTDCACLGKPPNNCYMTK